MNTYNVKIFNISEPDSNNCVFTHESFHLWEFKIQGILLSNSKDYVTVSADGLSILALGNIQKRIFKTNEGNELLIHSLDSYNFLRL